MGRARGPGPPRAGSLSVRENVLARLRAARGGFVPFSELIAAGWPGRSPPLSARAGLSNALTELRGDGFSVAVRYGEAAGAALVGGDDPDGAPSAAAKRAKRRCLGGCGKVFDSDGPHNRLCAPCSGRADPLPDHAVGRL